MLGKFKSGRTEVMYVQEVAGGQPEFSVATLSLRLI